MSQNYQQNLDYDAKAMAELTCIAFGWVQGQVIDPNPGQDVICGCNVCGFGVARRWTPSLSEQGIEDQVLAEFAQEAERRHCPHWQKYLDCKSEPAYKRAADLIAIGLLFDRLEPKP
jgi:hypothetical protein